MKSLIYTIRKDLYYNVSEDVKTFLLILKLALCSLSALCYSVKSAQGNEFPIVKNQFQCPCFSVGHQRIDNSS